MRSVIGKTVARLCRWRSKRIEHESFRCLAAAMTILMHGGPVERVHALRDRSERLEGRVRFWRARARAAEKL